MDCGLLRYNFLSKRSLFGVYFTVVYAQDETDLNLQSSSWFSASTGFKKGTICTELLLLCVCVRDSWIIHREFIVINSPSSSRPLQPLSVQASFSTVWYRRTTLSVASLRIDLFSMFHSIPPSIRSWIEKKRILYSKDNHLI